MNKVMFYVLLSLTLALFLTSCGSKEEETQIEPAPEEQVTDAIESETPPTNWEELERNAKATFESAKALSREKWEKIQSFSAEEWSQLGQRISDLKERGDSLHESMKPEISRVMAEVEQLLQEADTRLRALGESSGEKARDAQVRLEETWERMQQKLAEIQERMNQSD